MMKEKIKFTRKRGCQNTSFIKISPDRGSNGYQLRINASASRIIGHQYNRANVFFDENKRITIVFCENGKYQTNKDRGTDAIKMRVDGLVNELNIFIDKRYIVEAEKNRVSFTYTENNNGEQPDCVENVIMRYFDFCDKNNVIPTIEQLCFALDITPDEMDELCAFQHNELSHTLRSARDTVLEVWKIKLMSGNHEKIIRWLLEKYVGKKDEDDLPRTGR